MNQGATALIIITCLQQLIQKRSPLCKISTGKPPTSLKINKVQIIQQFKVEDFKVHYLIALRKTQTLINPHSRIIYQPSMPQSRQPLRSISTLAFSLNLNRISRSLNLKRAFKQLSLTSYREMRESEEMK